MMTKQQRSAPDAQTITVQRRAADPSVSAWVSANAGSGKTYVLATRVIRLLMAGHDPGSILCLTYTKTAAAEMKNRVFERLSSWVLMDEEALRKDIATLRNESETGLVSPSQVEFARTLFARALETPGGLKVQTIHAFCESILHRFPLEANIAGHFELLDERGRAMLLADARAHLLTAAPSEVLPSLARLLETLGEKSFDDLLTSAVGDQALLSQYFTTASIEDTRRQWRKAYGFGEEITDDDLLHSWLDGLTLTAEDAHAIKNYELFEKKKLPGAPLEFADMLLDAFSEPTTREKLNAALERFFTQGMLRKKMSCIPQPVFNRVDGLEERWLKACEHSQAFRDQRLLLASIYLSIDLIAVVSVIVNHYKAAKNAHGYLDFDDLIERTVAMLKRDEVADWVRYKLDAGIDHVLIDEAQDTSPAQWALIDNVIGDFFAGQSASNENRTLFVVGDPKQSIYSFQGADPRQFTQKKESYKARIRAARGQFKDETLDRSFRSTDDVLKAVDQVFSHPVFADGLELSDKPLEHKSLLNLQSGIVEIWQEAETEKAYPPKDWTAPMPPSVDGEQVVADRIADTIRTWLDTSKRIKGTGKIIEPGDIMVLVRKRGRFVRALSLALKKRDIAVAGADRLSLTQHPATLDLIALGRFVLDPGDDLSLAEILKSPIFNWDDDRLFDVAHGRDKQRLFSHMRLFGERDEAVAVIVAKLDDWIARARTETAFDFYARILTLDRVRNRMIGRLGAETPDVLDEFLNMALAAQKTGITALQVFINLLNDDQSEIKRELDQTSGQVRIMTVHGAKGLEAPIVFLVDPGSSPEGIGPSRMRYVQLTDPPEAVKHARADLLFAAKSELQPKIFADEVTRHVESARQEYRRLLYVGMTRAEDQLIITGYRGIKSKPQDKPEKQSWIDMAKFMLVNHGAAKKIEEYDFDAWRFQTTDVARQVDDAMTTADTIASVVLPDWFAAAVPAEPPAPRPLMPSGASGLSVETVFMDSGQSVQPTAVEPSLSLLDRLQTPNSEGETIGASAARRGTAMHRLLQVLPTIDPATRRAVADRYLAQFDQGWSAGDRAAMIADVLAVLDCLIMADETTAMVRAEVSIMGTVEVRGKPRAVSGIIDRLVTAPGHVRILDFKTNLRPPRSVEAINPIYITQMALYRALLKPLYPDCLISAHLIYTTGPYVHEVPETAMDRALGVISGDFDPALA